MDFWSIFGISSVILGRDGGLDVFEDRWKPALKETTTTKRGIIDIQGILPGIHLNYLSILLFYFMSRRSIFAYIEMK